MHPEVSMTRRVFGPLAIVGMGAGWHSRALAQSASSSEKSKTAKSVGPQPVTKYVAEFIVNSRLTEIPGDVVELAKKSMLDGLGLALCGSAAASAEIVRNYLKSRGLVRFRPRSEEHTSELQSHSFISDA